MIEKLNSSKERIRAGVCKGIIAMALIWSPTILLINSFYVIFMCLVFQYFTLPKYTVQKDNNPVWLCQGRTTLQNPRISIFAIKQLSYAFFLPLMNQVQVKISLKCKSPVPYDTGNMCLYQFFWKERMSIQSFGNPCHYSWDQTCDKSR